jgi:hypothetical protein
MSLIVSQWPKRRDTVRTWTFEWLHESEMFCSVGFEYEDCSVSTAASSIYLPTLRFDSPRGLFGYLPEPIKEKSLPSRESQQRQLPLPMRLPPRFRALRHRSLPHPNLLRFEATLQIPETTFLPMRTSLNPYILARNSPSGYDQVDQRLPMTMKMVAKGILKDHLVLAADSKMSTSIKKRFNNAGYKATFRPLKVQVPITESTLFTPMKYMRRLQRNVILIH